MLPMAAQISKQLTPFGRKITNARAAQVARYKCSVMDSSIPEHERQYHVAPFETIDDGLDRDGDNGVNDGVNNGNITSTALSDALTALDHGISANDTGRQGHVTSLTRCSCQYPKCWGLPCRHIFRVMMELGADCWTTCNDDDAILDSTFSN